MLTVASALELPCLSAARLVAGRAGMHAAITGVNIMEVPEVVRWLRGGEVLFTAGFAFKDSHEFRLSFPKALKDKGLAALCIKPGQYLDAIPSDLIDRCNDLSLPLIELPPNLPYMDVMLPVIEIIINDQLRRLQKSEEIHRRMTDTLLAGGGLRGIAQSLSLLTNGHPALIADRYGSVVGSYGVDLPVESVLTLEHSKSDRYAADVNLNGAPREGIAIPARVGSAVVGHVVVLQNSGQLDEQDLMAAEQASTAVALEFAKERAVAEAELRMAGELVAEVIGGRLRSQEAVLASARTLGLNPKRPLRVFLIEYGPSQEPQSADPNLAEDPSNGKGSRLLAISQYHLAKFPGASVLATRLNGVVGLVQSRERDDVRSLTNLLDRAVGEFRGVAGRVEVVAGVGRPRPLTEAADSYHDALTAIRVSRLWGSANRVTVMDDLGSYVFLAEAKSSESLLDFYRSTIGKLVDHDLSNGGELTKTLQLYFENRGSVGTTAKALFVHKNSVLYRLRRVEALTELDLQDAGGRFDLELALRVAPLIDPRFCTLTARKHG